MGDPVGAARHIRQAVDADGTWLIVEPLAGDTLAENRFRRATQTPFNAVYEARP